MKVTDPVCGAAVYLDEAATPHEHNGWLYFFCSAECRERFVEAPGQYNVRPTSTAAEKMSDAV